MLVPANAQVLLLETQQHSDCLGNTVFGNNDIFRAYKPFVQQWRSAAGKDGAVAPAYILTVDVSKAFDTVNTDLLLDMAKPLLRSHTYTIAKWREVSNGTCRCQQNLHKAC